MTIYELMKLSKLFKDSATESDSKNNKLISNIKNLLVMVIII